jgi:hypothetical protein
VLAQLQRACRDRLIARGEICARWSGIAPNLRHDVVKMSDRHL